VTHSGFLRRVAICERRRRAMSQHTPHTAVAMVMYSMTPIPISFMRSTINSPGR
jgi:hypothetical protein